MRKDCQRNEIVYFFLLENLSDFIFQGYFLGNYEYILKLYFSLG